MPMINKKMVIHDGRMTHSDLLFYKERLHIKDVLVGHESTQRKRSDSKLSTTGNSDELRKRRWSRYRETSSEGSVV